MYGRLLAARNGAFASRSLMSVAALRRGRFDDEPIRSARTRRWPAICNVCVCVNMHSSYELDGNQLDVKLRN
jgi:hypothetical protein